MLLNVVMAGKLYAQLCLQAIWFSVLAGTTSGIYKVRKHTNLCSDRKYTYFYQNIIDRLKAYSILTYYNKPLAMNTPFSCSLSVHNYHFIFLQSLSTQLSLHFHHVQIISQAPTFHFLLSQNKITFWDASCALKTLTSRCTIKLKFVNNNTVYILTFWHQSFTFNSNKSPTWCNNFSVYYPDVCLQRNMFRAFFRPSSGAQWPQWQPLVLPSYRDDRRAVRVNKRQDNKLENCCIWLVIYLN